jgi:hypothetical protein
VLAVQLLGLLKCAEHRCWTHNTYPSLTTPKIAHTPSNGSTSPTDGDAITNSRDVQPAAGKGTLHSNLSPP